jgi:2-keto-4-pentenoate hydratase
MDHASAIRAAQALVAARRAGDHIEALPEGAVPATEEDAYHVQDVVAAFVGERVAAWKVGATHPNAQKGLGVSGPVASRLFEPNLLRGDRSLPDDYVIRGVEAEYAFRMGEDLPPAGAPYSREAIAAAVISVHPAIEVLDTRFTAAQQGALAVADNVNDAQWVYGDGLEDWRALDLVGAAVNMLIDGEVVVRGSGAEVLGDPMTSLEWLINEHAARREGVKAGQFVTTGSCTGLYKAPPGCTATATFEGLGELSVRFVP